MVLKYIFPMLLLLVSCSEDRKVEVTPDEARAIPIEEISGVTPLRDYERRLTPERREAEEYLFSASWRLPADRTDSVIVWKIDEQTITPQIILHSRQPDYVFQTKSHNLKAGSLHEFQIRVLTDEAMELVFDATYEAYRKAASQGELLRTIRIDLR